MVPTAGLTDQKTVVLEAPVTVALNCSTSDPVSAVMEGVKETVTDGVSATVAVANFVGSAVLVAFTVTLCTLAGDAGAV